MKQNKIIDFLHSIGINKVEEFDIEFKSIKKDKTGKFLFEIEKHSPRDFDLLEYFLESLNSISYKFDISYCYDFDLNALDIDKLFKCFYFNKTKTEFLGSIEQKEKKFIISDEDVSKDDYESIFEDFSSFIDEINYPKYDFEYKDEKFINDETEECDSETEAIPDSMRDEEETINSESFEHIEDIAPDNELENLDETDINDVLIKVSSEDEMESYKNHVPEREAFDYKAHYRKRGKSSNFSISQIVVPDMNVSSKGIIFSIEQKEFKTGTVRFKIGVHEGTDAIFLSMFANKNYTAEELSTYQVGDAISFSGVSQEDKFMNNELVVRTFTIEKLETPPLRTDNYPEKRVELHLHTKMSSMDGVGKIGDYCKLAKYMGHKAIAITDHGVVQGFPDAQKAAEKTGLKMLYGAELYVVDDNYIGAFKPNNSKLNELTYIVFDLETTGLSIKYDKIIEFGAVKVVNGIVVDSLDILINPGVKLTDKIINITNISNEMLERKQTIAECIDEIMRFIGNNVLVSHNLEFDYGFLNEALVNLGRGPLTLSGVDTLALSRFNFPSMRNHRLGTLCKQVEVFYDEDSAHRADYDAKVLSEVWSALLYKLTDENKNVTLNDIAILEKKPEHIVHSREIHVTVLAKNRAGLKALYKLISFSHIDFFGRVPCVPRKLLNEYRENLIIGSGCFNGEVFDNATRSNEASLDKAVSHYDFIEIQPLENYSYLINTGNIDTEETLIKYIKDIEKSALKQKKLICVTGDCHYVDPEDKIFRDVYIHSLGVGKSSHPLNPFSRKKLPPFENPDQYFRSTEELMEEFTAIFGETKAKEYVITNTNLVADSCETIVPIIDHLFTPTIDNCENLLKDLCFENAHKLYGEQLPAIVDERLNQELNGIINGGFSVIYYIAHKIIHKANEDGYIVGSRGSVGSSIVATMANITEVNPLPPYYCCPKCKHFELYEGTEFRSGYDLPLKKCPVCGENMISDGQNIPFETFLGYNAGKVPDIDLNFPPDYQAIAHEYTKVLLGATNVYRAGTIGTVADKTAFGYVKGFLERSGKMASDFSGAKIGYLVSGCVDVKRTTGQHPGGIVVIPREYEVYDFTPVQYPADDHDATWQTTHLDFHAIHDTVLKLDLLGHVDPQILKYLSDSTATPISSIPLSDKRVISLFSSPKELHLKNNYIKATNGAIALPEFGTDFVRKMLDETKPKTFSDLVIISGLSHGTDVWRGNAESIIQDGTSDLNGVIGCRDDIMTYLISKGIDTYLSFSIMESVRKGKGLKDEWIKLMLDSGIPQFYIDSCLKIKYLFPKAHATAYVTNAIRVAWFKVYKPLDFYAAFFTFRCDNYEWETMVAGEARILERLDELAEFKKTNSKEYSKKYEEIEKVLVVSLEMYDRGISFANINLYKSEDTNFIPDYEHNTIIPPFKVIDGLGSSVANGILAARIEHKFVSVEDLVNRGKVNNTQVETFKRLHIIDDLPEKEIEQLNLFDF
ncbi:MAG: PolC-type DNA polymerase III [Bacilli bacterium]